MPSDSPVRDGCIDPPRSERTERKGRQDGERDERCECRPERRGSHRSLLAANRFWRAPAGHRNPCGARKGFDPSASQPGHRVMRRMSYTKRYAHPSRVSRARRREWGCGSSSAGTHPRGRPAGAPRAGRTSGGCARGEVQPIRVPPRTGLRLPRCSSRPRSPLVRLGASSLVRSDGGRMRVRRVPREVCTAGRGRSVGSSSAVRSRVRSKGRWTSAVRTCCHSAVQSRSGWAAKSTTLKGTWPGAGSLHGLALLGRESRPQRLVPRHDGREGAAQRPLVESALDPDGRGDVEDGAVRFQPVEEPAPLRRKGQGCGTPIASPRDRLGHRGGPAHPGRRLFACDPCPSVWGTGLRWYRGRGGLDHFRHGISPKSCRNFWKPPHTTYPTHRSSRRGARSGVSWPATQAARCPWWQYISEVRRSASSTTSRVAHPGNVPREPARASFSGVAPGVAAKNLTWVAGAPP